MTRLRDMSDPLSVTVRRSRASKRRGHEANDLQAPWSAAVLGHSNEKLPRRTLTFHIER